MLLVKSLEASGKPGPQQPQKTAEGAPVSWREQSEDTAQEKKEPKRREHGKNSREGLRRAITHKNGFHLLSTGASPPTHSSEPPTNPVLLEVVPTTWGCWESEKM